MSTNQPAFSRAPRANFREYTADDEVASPDAAPIGIGSWLQACPEEAAAFVPRSFRARTQTPTVSRLNGRPQ